MTGQLRITFVAFIAWSSAVFATAKSEEVPKALDPTAPPFLVGDLLFTFPRDGFAEDGQPIQRVKDVCPLTEAIDTSRAHFDIEDLIEWQVPRHEFVLDRATLDCFLRARFRWRVTWRLMPREGGFSGVPWAYHAYVTGAGRAVAPSVALWSAFPCQSDQPSFVRSHFDLKHATQAEGRQAVFGKEIARRARGSLDSFSRRQSLASSGHPSDESRGSGEPISWRLHGQTFHELGDLRFWEVTFADENWRPEDVLELRKLKVFSTVDGQLSTLSLGSEEPVGVDITTF